MTRSTGPRTSQEKSNGSGGLQAAQARNNAGIVRTAARQIFLGLDAALPNARFLDRQFLSARFMRAHKRLPYPACDSRATFNDLVFERMVKDDWSVLERFCIDKEFARIFVEATCRDAVVAREFEVMHLDSLQAEEVLERLQNFDGQPCVAKPTHGSGTVLFMRNGPGRQEIMHFCTAALRSYYEVSRESQYKGLERKIIVEEDLSVEGHAPEDYKFFCASGEVLFCQIDEDRFTDHRRVLVTPEFEEIDVRYMYDKPLQAPQKPENFSQMMEVARCLSKQFRFVRVDLYSVRGKVYFGELTFAPEGGAGPLSSEEFGVSVMQRIRSAGQNRGAIS
jgi:hypothetical protein